MAKVNNKWKVIGSPIVKDNIKYFKVEDKRNKKGFRLKAQLICADKTKALQSQKKECDINEIIKKHKLSGLPIEQPAYTDQHYGDFSQIPDYKDALQIVIDAQDAFSQLPSNVRKRFGHDPANMIEFCQNSDNYDEAVKLGLVDAKPVVADGGSSTNNSQPSQPVSEPQGGVK